MSIMMTAGIHRLGISYTGLVPLGKQFLGGSKTRLRAICEIIVNFNMSPQMILHPMGFLQSECCLIYSPIQSQTYFGKIETCVHYKIHS